MNKENWRAGFTSATTWEDRNPELDHKFTLFCVASDVRTPQQLRTARLSFNEQWDTNLSVRYGEKVLNV